MQPRYKYLTNGQRILTRGRIVGGYFSMWHLTASAASQSEMHGNPDVRTILIWEWCSARGKIRTLPPQNPPCMGNLDPRLKHGSLGPPKSTSQTASWSVQPLLQGSQSWPTDWQTDRPTKRSCYSICSNSLRLASAAMQPNNRYLGSTRTQCRLRSKLGHWWSVIIFQMHCISNVTGKSIVIIRRQPTVINSECLCDDIALLQTISDNHTNQQLKLANIRTNLENQVQFLYVILNSRDGKVFNS